MTRFIPIFLLIWLSALGAQGQDVTISDKTNGGETDVYHRFMVNARDFTWNIQNDLSRDASLELRLIANDDFNKSGYTILEQLPVKVPPGAKGQIHFSANYNRWIKERTAVAIDVYKVPSATLGGEKKRIQRINFAFTAEGLMQFWNPRYMRLSGWLPTVELSTGTADRRERIVEVRRIGSEAITARFQVNADFRSAFSFYTNEMNSRKLNNGDTFSIAAGGTSFIIQYNPPAGKEDGWMDTAAVSLTSTKNSANRLVFELRGQTGNGTVSAVTAPPDFDPNEVNLYGEGKPIVVEGGRPYDPFANAGRGLSLQDSLARLKFLQDSLRLDSIRKVAIPKIREFLARYRMVKFINDTTMANFRQDSGIWAAKVPLGLQKVERGAMGLVPGRMVMNPGENQAQLKVNEFYYDTLGGHIILSLPTGEDGALPVPMYDTLPVVMRLVPYYITADKDTFVPEEEEYRIKLEIPGQILPPPNTLMWILIGAGILLLLLLWLIRRRLARPVDSLAYLKELQYQKYRSGVDTKNRVEAALVEIDLNRKDLDLVQLEFPGRVLLATVPPPEKSRFNRVLKLIFLLGRRTRFLTYYYSFRVDAVYERIPDELEIKDEEGLFLLETDMTREVLATDHQDFILTDEEINYQVYIDTSEILAFDGPAKIIKIQFTITEEPFEGYSKYQQFVVPIKITPKRNLL